MTIITVGWLFASGSTQESPLGIVVFLKLTMKLSVVAELTEANPVCGGDRLDLSVERGFSSDLMSDVLTLDTENLLLITGLVNIQTIRTAEMADIRYILFVRNKRITAEMAELARENNMVLLETPFSLFKTSGILYNHGLKPVY